MLVKFTLYSDPNTNSNGKDDTEETVNHSFEVDDVDESGKQHMTSKCTVLYSALQVSCPQRRVLYM